MRLTVLGSSASYAGPGQACSGTLIQSGETSMLLDCGNGVLSMLAQVLDPLSLDAVVITHAHVDHFADLYSLQALLRYAPTGPAPALPLYAPPGLLERMGALLSESGRREMTQAFVVEDLVERVTIEAGDVLITPHHVDHVNPTFALVAEEISTGRCVCYTSDTAPGAAVERAAGGAHMLLAEATLPQQYAGRVPHMTAREAAQLASRVDAERLVLTHIWPTTDREVILHEAAEVFSGPVTVAKELDSFSV